MTATYQICTSCIMDTSDPAIVFDAQGVCSHCHAYASEMRRSATDPETRQRQLEARINAIIEDGKGKPYDCIAGVSGGVDSTYVLLLAKRYGLRPLAVHLDNGWDSEIAVGNIHRALETLGLELVTKVLDWDEFRDLQVAFLKASTPDSEIPTDHAIVATVFQTAWSHGIKHLILGYNRATELLLPPAWSQGHFDWRYISAVQKQYGTRKLRDFPHLNFPNFLRFRYATARHTLNILDYVDYSRASAMSALASELGWRDYGGKHHESVYTRFFQAHILPKKFGFDKRRAHLSNQILAGQITREVALEAIAKPPYESADLERQDRAYVIKKLGLSDAEFEGIMAAKPRRFEEFPNMYQTPAWKAARALIHTFRRLVSARTSPA